MFVTQQTFLVFQDVFKTSWRRLQCNTSSSKTSWRRLQDVIKTYLQYVFLKRLQDVFKTSSSRFQNIFKTSSRPLQDVFKTCLQEVLQLCLQDVFKTSWETKKCYTEDVFSTSSRRRIFAGKVFFYRWFFNMRGQ